MTQKLLYEIKRMRLEITERKENVKEERRANSIHMRDPGIPGEPFKKVLAFFFTEKTFFSHFCKKNLFLT